MKRATYSNITGKNGALVGESSQCGDCRYVDPLLDQGLSDIEIGRLEIKRKRETD